MHLHYLLIAHKNPEQLKRLIERLKYKNCSFYIHIDKNANIQEFKRSILENDQITFVPEVDRIESKWCDIGTVNATLALLKQVDFEKKPGYCILMSGQDYPVKSNEYIYNYFLKHKDSEFINIFSLPNPIWLNNGLLRLAFYKIDLSSKKGDLLVIPSIYNKEFYTIKNIVKTIICIVRGRIDILQKISKKRTYPSYLEAHGGDTWWTLSTETLSKILDFKKIHPDYLLYHTDTFCPDETMFHSIIPLYQNELKRRILPSTTYSNWTNPDVYKVGMFSKYQLPRSMNMDDFETIQSLPEHILFARKFDFDIDIQILDKIDETLLN